MGLSTWPSLSSLLLPSGTGWLVMRPHSIATLASLIGFVHVDMHMPFIFAITSSVTFTTHCDHHHGIEYFD
jgi:hypothetical protein